MARSTSIVSRSTSSPRQVTGPTIRFLDGVATTAEVRRLVTSGKPVMAAVAFWGEGVTKSLGITKNSHVEIVCDVLSGGCNPREIRRLRDVLGPERVRTADGLHAKVWFTDQEVILGSSNASSNGLALADVERDQRLEANCLVRDKGVHSEVSSWWASVVAKKARKVTEADLEIAGERFRSRRRTRPLPPFRDLLCGLTNAPDAFRDRDLLIWIGEWGEPSERGLEVLNDAVKQYHDESLHFYEHVTNEPPGGSCILDFDARESPPRFAGMWRLLAQPVYGPKSKSVLLCKKVSRFEGLAVGNRMRWRQGAAAALEAGDVEIDAVEFARKYLVLR